MEFHEYVCTYIVGRPPKRRKTLNTFAHDAERNLTGRRSRLPQFLAAACAATVAGAAFGSSVVRVDASDADLWKSLFQGQILLVGETHQREGSLHLMRRVVEMAQTTHACVTLAVEVAADQQGALDRVVEGVASVQAVAVWDAIDFPAYRVFLDEMLRLSARDPAFVWSRPIYRWRFPACATRQWRKLSSKPVERVHSWSGSSARCTPRGGFGTAAHPRSETSPISWKRPRSKSGSLESTGRSPAKAR